MAQQLERGKAVPGLTEKPIVEEFSWRSHEYQILPGVMDQRQTNACGAISIMMTMESRNRLARCLCGCLDYKPLTIEHFLFNHCHPDALKYIGDMKYNINWFEKKGVPFREDYPCVANNVLCIGRTEYVSTELPDMIARHVCTGGPVVLSFPIYTQFDVLRKDPSQIYRGEGDPVLVGEGVKGLENQVLGHSVVIVGFKKVDGVVEYFEFQNHSGTDWCDGGYGKIAAHGEFFSRHCTVTVIFPFRDQEVWPKNS